MQISPEHFVRPPWAQMTVMAVPSNSAVPVQIRFILIRPIRAMQFVVQKCIADASLSFVEHKVSRVLSRFVLRHRKAQCRTNRYR